MAAGDLSSLVEIPKKLKFGSCEKISRTCDTPSETCDVFQSSSCRGKLQEKLPRVTWPLGSVNNRRIIVKYCKIPLISPPGYRPINLQTEKIFRL